MRARLLDLIRLMDAIAEKCGWHKLSNSIEERKFQERYMKYLEEASEIERRLGL